MPELPEVEVTRLSFASSIAGARILAVRVGKPLRWPLQCEPDELLGMTVEQVRRRGKYLLLDLTSHSANSGLLLMHLGMSGSLSFAPQTVFGVEVAAAGKHDHFDLVTTHGLLRLNDPRRFGAVVFVPAEQSPTAQKLLGKLGVEPLTDAFDVKTFHQGLKNRQNCDQTGAFGRRNWSLAWVIFMRLKRCLCRVFVRRRELQTSACPELQSCMRQFKKSWHAPLPKVAARCKISQVPRANRATSS